MKTARVVLCYPASAASKKKKKREGKKTCVESRCNGSYVSNKPQIQVQGGVDTGGERNS